MIELTRLNHDPIILNSDLIEHIEVTPDTVISLTTGQRFMVRERPDEVIQKVIEFRRAIATASCAVLSDRVPGLAGVSAAQTVEAHRHG